MSIKESNPPERKCLFCQQPILGRSDKKFCSTPCRNAWHNEQRHREEKVVREINRILKKNWKILRKLNIKGKTKVSRMHLLARDFDFQYITGYLITKDQNEYRYCYNQGYLQLDKDQFLLVTHTGNRTL